MSYNKGIRSAPRRKCPPAANNRRPSEQPSYGASAERKTRSIQSLQESLFFSPKRPRTRRHRHLSARGGGGLKKAQSSSHSHRFCTLMESGLIQIPYLQHCDYYETPSPHSISSGFSMAGTAASSISSSTSASSAITARHSSMSPLEYTSSDDSFSCDEVMSLVSSCCPDMAMSCVLDFMPQSETRDQRIAALIDHIPPSLLPAPASDPQATRSEGPDDDGEPYDIDLRDFQPDVNSLSPPQDCGGHHRSYGGGVLCLRLDYEEVLRAWKERQQEFHASEKSIYYYSASRLDPLHIFEYYPLTPHPTFL